MVKKTQLQRNCLLPIKSSPGPKNSPNKQANLEVGAVKIASIKWKTSTQKSTLLKLRMRFLKSNQLEVEKEEEEADLLDQIRRGIQIRA